jgi:hypothetical protein
MDNFRGTISAVIIIITLTIVGIIIYGYSLMPEIDKANITKQFLNILAGITIIGATIATAVAIIWLINMVKVIRMPGQQYDPNSFSGKIERTIQIPDKSEVKIIPPPQPQDRRIQQGQGQQRQANGAQYGGQSRRRQQEQEYEE